MNAPACPVCDSSTRSLAWVDRYRLHACGTCRLEFLHPQPDDTALGDVYGRHYYAAWGIDRHEKAVRALKMNTFRRRIAAVRSQLPVSARVLDVGCATGYFLEAATEAGLDPFGVELSAYGIEICRQKVAAGHLHQGELESAHFEDWPDGQFDAIFMSDLIEHVRDPHRTLSAAYARLRPGGLVVITTPWTGSLSRRLAGRRWLHYKPEHLFYFGASSLRHLLVAHDFEMLRTEAAVKCLSLGYAATQFSAGGRLMQGVTRLLYALPRQLRDRPLWLNIGEATLVARRHSCTRHDATSA